MLDDRSIPDFAQIEVGLGFPCLLEIVVEGSVEDGELDADVIQILARRLEGIFPVFSAAEDVCRLGSLSDMIDKVADEGDIDAVVRALNQ